MTDGEVHGSSSWVENKKSKSVGRTAAVEKRHEIECRGRDRAKTEGEIDVIKKRYPLSLSLSLSLSCGSSGGRGDNPALIDLSLVRSLLY